MMIIGTSHGWAKSDVDLFWSQSGGATHLVGPQVFSAELDAGAFRSIHGQFKPAVATFNNSSASKSLAHVEVGYSFCSAEISTNHSRISLLCPEPAKLFFSEKPAMPGFESNSFIFRPPILS